MTDPSNDDPQDLLAATRDLSRRVRLVQRGAWFPMVVFAAVTLAAVPFSRYGRHPIHCASVHTTADVCTVRPALALWYWPVAVLAAYVAISWFYLRRSRERGVGTRVQPYVVVGVVLTVLITTWAFWSNTHPAFLAGTLRLARGQPPAEFLYRIATPAAAIGLALLLLAWIERSWSLLTLTVVYLIVAVTTVGLGRFRHPSPWAFLPHFLVDAGVLLLGGILLAVTQRAHGSASA